MNNIKTNNLRNRPVAQDYKAEKEKRGTGQLESVNAYLRNDPVSYFYQRFTDDKNAYLRDDMWAEANMRGEGESLVSLLQGTTLDNFDSTAFDAIMPYGDRVNYDSYMLALQLPHLDNTKKVERIDEETGYVFGEFTDQEWAQDILDFTIGRWDAEIIEENKQTRIFLADVGTQVVSGITNIVGGAFDFLASIWDVGEGLLNMMANWSGDDNIGNRFLAAFDDNETWNDPFAKIGDWLGAASFEFQRQYGTTVNAVDAHNAGYALGDGNWLQQLDNAVAVGAGYSTWGRWMNGGTHAIGFMLPTIALGIATGGASTGAMAALNKSRSLIFYTGIFSGQVKDTVQSRKRDGISYKELNSGEVLGNALVKSAAQYAVEKALGLVLGYTGVDKLTGMAGKTIKQAGMGAAEATVKGGFAAAGRVLKTGIKEAIQEGLEETLQELSDLLVDYTFGGTYRSEALADFSIQNLTDAFIVGAMTSIAIGSVSNAVVSFNPNNTMAGVDADGNLFKLGAFQTITLREAMGEMSGWMEIINNPKASVDKKAKAMFQMEAATTILGDIYKNMGTDRAVTADAIIGDMLKQQSKADQIAATKTVTEYANKLWDSFLINQEIITATYNLREQTKMKDKLNEAVADKEEKLKEANVTDVPNIITPTMPTKKPVNGIDPATLTKLSTLAKELGVDMLVGVNGGLITKSNDVVFVNNDLIISGDVSAIVQGLAYDLTIDTVIANLPNNLIDTIVQSYESITGLDGDVNKAVTALLFDKKFYTYMLLKMKEKSYGEKAFGVMTTIDKLIKSRLTKNVLNGSLTEKAYKTLLTKVQKNMQSGIMNFATQYSHIDLGRVDNAIIPANMKAAISSHKNVRFTEMVNEGIKNAPASSLDARTKLFDKTIDNYGHLITAEQIALYKVLARSPEYNQRVEAYSILTYLATVATDTDNKLTYLPAFTDDVSNKYYQEILDNVAKSFGSGWAQLKMGLVSFTNMSQETKDFLATRGIKPGQTNSHELVMSTIREMVYTASNKRLTLSLTGDVMEVMDRKAFIKPAYYHNVFGQTRLINDIKNGTVKTVGDISKLSKAQLGKLADVKLQIDPKIVGTRINGLYQTNGNAISLSGNLLVDTIMHEVTHYTQDTFKSDRSGMGGSEIIFQTMPTKERDSLISYLKGTFPLAYDLMKNDSTNDTEIIYFMLGGEIQANSISNSIMFETGFTWRNDKTTLVSPDGKHTWSTLDASNPAAEVKAKLDKTKQKRIDKKSQLTSQELTSGFPRNLNMDSPLTPASLIRLSENSSIIDYMKGAYLINEHGVPMIFYRGWSTLDSETEIHLAKDGKIEASHKGGEFYSTDPKVSTKFGMDRSPTINGETFNDGRMEGFISNLTESEIRIYDVEGTHWEDLGDYYSDNDLAIYYDLYEASRQFTTAVGYAAITAKTLNLDEVIMKQLSTAQQVAWTTTIQTLMDKYNVDNATARTALTIAARWEEDLLRTDDMIPVNMLQGYKAIIINDVNEAVEGADKTATNLIILQGTSLRKVTSSAKDFNWSQLPQFDNSRYISNKVAEQSNLKYFIRKGQAIQLSPNVANFVQNTTGDFAKLPNVLKNKILDGKLNMNDIKDYVATTKSMNDTTFKAIALYAYNNEALAKLDFKTMRNLMNNIVDLHAVAEVDYANSLLERTPDEMLMVVKATYARANKSNDAAEKLAKAQQHATTVKYGDEYIDISGDIMQMTPAFFRHYDGTLQGLRHINNFSKMLAAYQIAQEYIDNMDHESDAVVNKRMTRWDWIDKAKYAEIDYEVDKGLTESVESIDKDTKIEAITNYIVNELLAKVEGLSQEQKMEQLEDLQEQLEQATDALTRLSDHDLNARYLATLTNEMLPAEQRVVDPLMEYKNAPRSTKNIKDSLRNVGRTLTKRIAGLKRRYNMLSPEVKAVIDPKTYKLDYRKYTNLSDAELEALTDKLREDSNLLNDTMRAAETRRRTELLTQERLAREASKQAKADLQKLEDAKQGKKTFREKVNVVHTTKVINQTFNFESREQSTKTAETLLSTQWDKQRQSKVQGLSNNAEQNVHNGKLFYNQNADTLLVMNTVEAEATVRWFMDANMVGIAADSNEAQTYAAVKMYTLGYIYSEIRKNGVFSDFNTNLKNRLENHMKSTVTSAGTTMAVWNNMKGMINPVETMISASMEMGGVLIDEISREALIQAAEEGNIDRIVEIQQTILDQVNREKTTKRNVLRKITAVRSMAMLSSPVTWLRNIIGNAALKNMNKLSSKIGDKIASKKTAQGQFKMDGAITPQIQNFINANFLDNKLFDTLISKLSRYNPSDIQRKYKDNTGQASKDAIFTNMVIKSMYNEFYNQNMFNNPMVNKIHQTLMTALSDNNYVREATVRYFGKILAERGHSLTDGVTDAIMNDFATAVGMGMSDYMHSDNVFNKIETVLAEKSETALFAYKLVIPFASAGWNWFKASLRYSPVGLGQSIFKLATLESQIIKAENDWAKGTAQVAPELTEYLIRRDLGSGIIGTASLAFGAILAGLGFVALEDDDYGVPKLRIGNLHIDISTIFGSSSVLAGMALVKGAQDGDWLTALDAMLDPLLDGFFMIQLLEMDKYNRGGFGSLTLNFLEQTLLSFIPNGVRWLSGMTYTGKYQTNKFYEKAVARIPFLGSAFGLDKKVDPFTGETGGFWDIFNRTVPFLEVRKTSAIKDDAKVLGINKKELRGDYTINGDSFKLSGKQTAELNKSYGEWNAAALSLFYQNKSRHSVRMANGSFRTLSYNQMDDAQRKNVVQSIFTKNANVAKISAWLADGNSYYASQEEYNMLRKYGIKGTYYKGTRGFVKK